MNRLIVIAHGISPLGTMGGNSKIIIEVLKNLPAKYQAAVITMKPESFTGNGVTGGNIKIVPIPKPKKDDWLHMPQMSAHTLKYTRRAFQEIGAGPDDVVYCVSDFPLDSLPGSVLKKKFGYTWIPSFYLFVPSPSANLSRHFGFPFFKYVIYYLCQRLIFGFMLKRADGFAITNDSDVNRFPPRYAGKILAVYGGVNIEQIRSAQRGRTDGEEKKYDAVFCSRLHPQKGISRLLDIWKDVTKKIPSAKLAVIGNGSVGYEKKLHDKADGLNLAGNIDWLGYVNNEEKYGVYLSSKMLLHATVYDNNGMVAAEALCCGLPVVMYDLPALRHVYTDGCVKIPEGDEAAFAGEVVKMITDAEYRNSVAADSEKTDALREKWDWKNRTEMFTGFISGIAGNQG